MAETPLLPLGARRAMPGRRNTRRALVRDCVGVVLVYGRGGLAVRGVEHLRGGADAVTAMALSELIKQLRPMIEKRLEELELCWEDIESAIEQIDTVSALEDAVANPADFLKNLLTSLGPAGIRMLVHKLRPKLEPILEDRGLE